MKRSIQGCLGVSYWAWGMGHWAWGIGHGALGIGQKLITNNHLPSESDK
ncbi:hypothetical protein [Nostoc sp. KVJ20]|nr:hypothetical protein [Nostoc sp. KVJ20]